VSFKIHWSLFRSALPRSFPFFPFQIPAAQNALDRVNSESLCQFEANCLTINGGIAVDARLINNKEIDEFRKKPDTSQSNSIKTAQPTCPIIRPMPSAAPLFILKVTGARLPGYYASVKELFPGGSSNISCNPGFNQKPVV